MRFRKLRIAWSVVWGMAAVLLVVLWVRSYSHGEGLLMPLNNGTRLASHHGRLGLEPDDRATQWEWRIEYAKADLDPNYDWDRWERATPHWIGTTQRVMVPHWFPLIVAGSLSAAPWLRLRFSLRTLLIATTLIAVVLGLIVWLSG